MMTLPQFQEKLNIVLNQAMANIGSQSGSSTALTVAGMITTLNNAVTALTGSTLTHDRTISDPGVPLNPSQP
jgi:hypothetical protein